MKTEITRFCEGCLAAIAPLGSALADTAEQLGTRPDLGGARGTVAELQTRLRSLSEKLANQNTHLLIFGPLKSGKSTLMNAISGAYVSEVTSLPGYPALVFVQHAPEPSFSATRFNGRESTFPDARVLKGVIEDGHLALAEQLRAAEARGADFDPRRDFAEAIRRIDVKLPIESLAESSTVLVDTPGLYSRMNFGYDVLTREFRDTAACAVFVVKTDNLFLEQVFAEFNQLLDLFSRIFLVVNVDSGKRDLQPDGSLLPSAESESPERVIEAFKTLSMAGPVRRAQEEGRVRIHAIDLLHAAAARLTSAAATAAAPEVGNSAAFEAFLRDLTDYLNGSTYTREFIRDSLRQCETLGADVNALVAGPEVSALHKKQDAIAAEIARLDERIAAYDRLLKLDWRATFTDARVDNARRSATAAQAASGELGRKMLEALDRWYASSDSLKSLEKQYWNPLLSKACGVASEDTVKHLRRALAGPLGGAAPGPETLQDLRTLGVELGASAAAALTSLKAKDAEPFRISVKSDSVPVRRLAADWLSFRGAAAVADHLFGEDRTREIAAWVKEQRLPASSRAAFLGLIESTVSDKFPEAPARSASFLLEHYIEKFSENVTAGLEKGLAKDVRLRAERQGPNEQNAQVVASLRQLLAQAARVRAEIAQIAKQEAARPSPPTPPKSGAKREDSLRADSFFSNDVSAPPPRT